MKLKDLLNEEIWKAEGGSITLNGEKVGDYSFDSSAGGFFIDDINGKGEKGFDYKAEMLDYIKKNKREYLKARQNYIKKGYMNDATMHPMTRERALDNLREVILNIKPYSREVVKHCEAAIKIIEKFKTK
jgi:hypothetical protein